MKPYYLSIISVNNVAISIKKNSAVEYNIRQGMATFKTLLAGFSSTDHSNGKSSYTTYNYLTINEFKTKQKENKRPEDKGER